MLILAGPGTGKTRTLVAKFAHLVKERRISPERILITTFTRKASEELESRIGAALRQAGHYGRVEVQNFHGFALRLLEEQGIEAGFPAAVRVLDGVALKRYVHERRDKFDFPNVPFVRQVDYQIGELLRFTSHCLSQGWTADDARRRAAEVHAASKEPDRTIKFVDYAENYGRLLELLKAEGVYTFDTMLHHAVELLQKNESLRKHIQARYDYLLVDEVQDNNRAQARLIELLVGDRPCVTVVGDEDQGIYKFRGAHKTIFQEFADRFRPETVNLVENHRSTPAIPACAERVVKKNTGRFAKPSLQAVGPHKASTRPVEIVACSDPEQLVLHVADLIEAEIAKGRKASQIAVLHRTLNRLGSLPQELEARNIPYEVTQLGQLLRFRVVRDLAAWLRVLAQPTLQNPAVARILAGPEIGLELWDLGEITKALRRMQREEHVRQGLKRGDRDLPLSRAIQRLEQLEVSDKTRAALERARAILEKLDSTVRNESALTTAERVLAALRLHHRSPHDETASAQTWRNVADFLRIVQEHAEASGDDSLEEFVEYLDYAERQGDLLQEREPDVLEDSVKLLTIHRAKGLEFEVVIVPHLADKQFPTKLQGDTLSLLVDADLTPEERARNHIEEERRLFYVAATRAKERLVLVWLETEDGRELARSPFLDEMTNGAPAPQIAERALTTKLVPRAVEPIAPTARRPPAPAATPVLSLSASALDSYAECPRQYYFRHHLGIPVRQNASAVAGSNVHRALEVFHQTHKGAWRTKTTDDLLTIYEQVFAAGRFDSPQEAEKWRERDQRILRAYLEEEQKIDGEPTHFEVPFEWEWAEAGATFHGFIDRVDEHKDGSWEIVDYKTGKRGAVTAILNDDFQMALYVLALERSLGKKVRAGTFYWLQAAGDGTGPIERMRIPRAEAKKAFTNAALGEFEKRVASAVNGIKAGAFGEEPEDFKCRYCSFRILCPSWEE